MPSFGASVGTTTAVSGESPVWSTRVAADTAAGIGAAAGAATGAGCGFGAHATTAAAMVRMSCLRIVAASTTQLRQIFREAHVRIVPGATQLAGFGTLFHRAA